MKKVRGNWNRCQVKVTLCDPIWHVISHGSEMSSISLLLLLWTRCGVVFEVILLEWRAGTIRFLLLPLCGRRHKITMTSTTIVSMRTNLYTRFTTRVPSYETSSHRTRLVTTRRMVRNGCIIVTYICNSVRLCRVSVRVAPESGSASG